MRRGAGRRNPICRSSCPTIWPSTSRAIRSTPIRPGSTSTCPKCGGAAVRDTDTLDTFVDSSWYFARFCDTTAEEPVNRAAVDYWLPVDQYIGGIEHAILHLLYARFFIRAMKQAGLCQDRRAVRRPVHPRHGLPRDLQGQRRRLAVARRGGKARRQRVPAKARTSRSTVGPSEKMSKSKKNVVAPEADHRHLRRRHDPLVHAVGHAARTRHRMDRRRRGRLLAIRPAHLAAGERSRRPAAAGHADRRRRRRILELRRATHAPSRR